MYEGRAIIGREIIGECIKYEEKNKKKNIIDRQIRIYLKHRSRKRTGQLSKAYVNTEIIKNDSNEKIYVSNINLNIIEQLERLYKIPFVLKRNGEIKSCLIIGECSKLGRVTIIPNHSGVHQGQRVPMKCNKFSLCYIDPSLEPTYKKL